MFQNISGLLSNVIKNIIYLMPAVIICMTIHEWSHAFASYKLGDYTAKEEGRLSFNPLRHIDPLGAIFFVLAGFGWAKPVPIKALYFAHPRRDVAITALCGPLSNFVFAFVLVPFLSLSYVFIGETNYITKLILYMIQLSIGFGIFNLIPIPPLDGSRLLMYFLSPRAAVKLIEIERYSFLLLFVLLAFFNLDRYLGSVIRFVFSGYIFLAELIINLIS